MRRVHSGLTMGGSILRQRRTMAIVCVAILAVRLILTWFSVVAQIELPSDGFAARAMVFGLGAFIVAAAHSGVIYALLRRPIVGAILVTVQGALTILAGLADWGIVSAISMLFAIGAIYFGWQSAASTQTGFSRDGRP